LASSSKNIFLEIQKSDFLSGDLSKFMQQYLPFSNIYAGKTKLD
jgi:hypothetical protein